MLYKGLTFFHRGLLKVKVTCAMCTVEQFCFYFAGGKHLVEFIWACFKMMSQVYVNGLFQKGV